ncbi:MAG: hypothetical protein RL684_514, partial [Pseudomonadota bacterium]
MNTPKLTLLLLAFAGSLALARPAAAADTPAAVPDKGSITITHDGKHSVTIKAEIKTKTDKQAPSADAESGADMSAADGADEAGDSHGHGKSGDSIVNIGSDSTLEAGRSADTVVAVMGNASSAGDVGEALVAVLGDARSTGTIGESVVAVLGNSYVDGPVNGSVVAAMGNVELGPHAVVEGQVVAVGGALKRDPAAIVHGEVEEVNIFGAEGVNRMGADLHAWIRHCMLLGRPLAFGPNLAWAWELAAVYLAVYLLIALLFPSAMRNCLDTMEQRSGRSIVAAVLAVPLKYVAIILLAVTGIGVLLIPFAGLALWLGGALGKAVAFAWIGRRLLPRTDSREPGPLVLATLVGALVATAFYVVPFVGFFVYKALAVLGLGIVVYTLILHWFPEKREPGVAGPGAATGGVSPAGAQPTAAGATDAGAGASAGDASAAAATGAAAGPATPLADASSYERAGFWLRMAALGIDLVLVAIAIGFLPLVDHSMQACIALTAVYGAIMWKLRGTTVGGIICHVRLARLDGQPIDWGTAIVRALGCFLSLLAAGVGFLWMIWDPERQAWHDKIAGTIVVRDT